MSSKRVLLLGVTGFIGKNLANVLAETNFHVYGTYIHQNKPSAEGGFAKKIKLLQCDVTNKRCLETILKKITPNFVFYLAAQSSVKLSWLDPIRTIQINFLGGVYLLECIRKMKLKPKIMIFSSGTTYGESHRSKFHLKEESCLRPKDPYSVSKAALDIFARLYASAHKLHVVVVRLANITGPGQLPNFSIPNFASQIATIEKGQVEPTIKVGNLSVKRDFLDIRDCVRAIQFIMHKGCSGEVYNIASGKSLQIREIFERMIDLSHLDRNRLKIRVTSQLIPKDEISEIRLNPSKLKRLAHWEPKIPFEKTLTDILNEWRLKTST